MQVVDLLLLLLNVDALIYLFFCLIAPSRASCVMLNRNNKSQYTCLVPDLTGKIFHSFTIIMMLAVHFIGLKTIPSIPSLFSVLSQMVLDFVKCFFCCHSDDHMVLFLFLLICFITLILCMLDQPWIPRINLGYGVKSFLDLVS